ncbi:unnamed protein product [Didymodactylos carnosus]|uniref:Uncharacterized protein n=1 Tax=Didymodactylos carnosus TaxID=1234261 RepID=A0A815P6B3_9BILA|nr:unnamed protein product [Didymodactylos carnosus]CAF4319698.1 unnamed protein product [Didymodactylos carnosus]
MGLGHTKAIDKVTCIKGLKFPEDKVHLAACGSEHSIVATTRDFLYGFGSNSFGQLGIDSKKSNTKAQLILAPTQLSLDHVPANVQWKQLACGAHHSSALTSDGFVYVWGSNSEGQCGVEEKQMIKLLYKLKLNFYVHFIACGQAHTALIDNQGRLHTFGSNRYQQLGRTGEQKQIVPVELPYPIKIKSVACGYQHTIVLDTDGYVYTCGTGEQGQLGNEMLHISSPKFKIIKTLQDRTIVSIACGAFHTGTIDENGRLYLWGEGRFGKLGFTEENEFRPQDIII